MTVRSDVDLFRRAGEALYGPQWQRALARALGPLHPAGARPSIDDRYVRRIAAGDKPVPAWMWGALGELVRAEKAGLGDRRARLDEIATALRSANRSYSQR